MSSHSSSHTAAHHADGKLSSVRDEFAELKDSVHSGTREATQHTKRLAQAATGAAKDAVVGLRDSAIDVRDRVGKSVSERPFTTIAIAAAAGAALMGLAIMWRRKG